MKLRNIMIVLAASALLCGCGTSQKKEPLSLWVIPDLHYLSPSLYREDSKSFQRLLSANDGKMIERMPEILSEITSLALAEKPDLILIPGDLTMNGEYQSLLDLRESLQKLQDAGIPVLVIPGNHDIAYPLAIDFSNDSPLGIRNISQQEFTELMKQFGYENSRSHAEDSFSYTFEAADDFWIMALDSNTEVSPGQITESTLLWAQEELRYARDHNIHVISMTHQNVLPQSEFFSQGYVIDNAPAVEHLLKSGSVALNLSGHSHLQHTSVSEGLTDICTESTAVWPIGIGIVNVADDRSTCTYEKRLLHEDDETAKQRLNQTISRSIGTVLAELSLSDEEAQRMSSFASSVNLLYYTGQLSDSTPFLESEEWKLWTNHGSKTLTCRYLSAILNEFRPASE